MVTPEVPPRPCAFHHHPVHSDLSREPLQIPVRRDDASRQRFHQFKVTATDGGYVPESAQYPETTVLVPVGSTRVIEFVPEVSGDWAMHCHMTHHVMTQMGHGLPPMVGVDTKALDQRMARVLPEYMPMGADGMGGMGDMGMPVPPNSLPMRGAPGPFSYIDMGGMFTVLKVRDRVAGADPKGWYAHPAGTTVQKANDADMARDGIDPKSSGTG